ncbi:MAG: YitT family protein [Clostridia bacterium]|nr:YitT family protein [Clostridia bacterium]MDY5554378.1 YitT family protein [Blautia sp.]
MRINGKKKIPLEYLMIIAGTGLMSIAINSVFDASGMVTGGFSGISIILKKWTSQIWGYGIPLWVTNFVLNIPLFLTGWKICGFSFVKKAIVGEISLSFWLAVQPVWNLAGNDLLLAALYGGVIMGTGIGLVFLGGGTTGGTDMMAAIIQKYIQHYSIAQIMQVIDGLIVLVGMYVFGVHEALYAIIAVFIVTKVSDGLIEGIKFSKTAYIITSKPDEISEMIMNDLKRGVTGINARGMYSGEDKLMLFCVVNKKQIVLLKKKVDEIDPDAFVIVSDAREVHGEGFLEKNKSVVNMMK